MQIKVDARELDKLVKGVERLQQQIPGAIARGLNEGGDRVRTQVKRAIKQQTGLVRMGSVDRRMRTARAFAEQADLTTAVKGSGVGQGMAYQIIFTGKPTKMYEFKTKVKKGPGGGVTAYMWDRAIQFKRSFQGSGTILGQLKMRVNGESAEGHGRLPLRGFDGPNLAKEAVKGSTAETFFRSAEAYVPPIVAKHVAKSLGL